MKKKVLAMLLAFSMVFSNTAFLYAAEEGEAVVEETQEEAVPEETKKEEEPQAPAEEPASEPASKEPAAEEKQPEEPEKTLEQVSDEVGSDGQSEPAVQDSDPDASETPAAEQEQEAGSTGEKEDHPVIKGVLPLKPEQVSVTPGEKDGQSSEELFSSYVDSAFVKSPSGKKRGAKSVGSGLSGINAAIYNKIAGQLPAIAAGEQASTIFTVSADELGLEQTSWTAEELGVASIFVLDENGDVSLNDQGEATIAEDAAAAVYAMTSYDLSRIIGTLLADHPYHLYWYEKTQETTGTQYDLAVDYDEGRQEYVLSLDGNIELCFPVANDYSAGDFTVDTSVGQTVQAAVQNAQSIVDEYSGLTDDEKLRGYKEEICDLVSYNEGAAEGNAEYGNPWQLIWVFDGDPETNVVCEGYAKAFKYLCDLSSFEWGTLCITVTGTMNGGTGEGAHMWNIVHIDDAGENYLVDVTNCDVGSVGAPNYLYMAGTRKKILNGDMEIGYQVYANGEYVEYRYDEDTLSLYDQTELIIADCGIDPADDPQYETSAWLNDYDYWFDDDTLVLYGHYKGTETEVTVPATALVGGLPYNKIRLTPELWSPYEDEDGEKHESYVRSLSFETGVILPEDCTRLFYNMNEVTSIDLSNLDTSCVTNMYGMFMGCNKLTGLDVSGFDTSKVYDFRNMFDHCGELRELDLSHFAFSGLEEGNAENSISGLIDHDYNLRTINAPAGLLYDVALPAYFRGTDGEQYSVLPKGMTESITLSFEEAYRIPAECIFLTVSSQMFVGQEEQAVVTILQENASDMSFTVSSDDPAIVSVTEIEENVFILKALQEGTVTITASTKDGTDISDSRMITVVNEKRTVEHDGVVYTIEDQEASVTGYTGEPVNLTILSHIEGIPVTSIKAEAFIYCSSLQSVVFEEGSTLTTIGPSAFLECSELREVVLPESLVTIREYAFYRCYKLEQIDLPEGLKTAKGLAYAGLKSIHIPSTVTDLSIYGNENITSITVAEDNEVYKAIDNVLYVKKDWDYSSISNGTGNILNGWGLLLYPREKQDAEFELWEEALVLSEDCDINLNPYLKTIVLSDHCDISKHIPRCTVIVRDSNVNYCSDGDFLLSKDRKTLIKYQSQNKKTVTVPDYIEVIGSKAFYQTDAKKIILPEGVRCIGTSAFAISKIQEIVLPDSLEEIGESAFYYCSWLKSVTIPENITEIKSYTFAYCANLHTLNFNNGLRSIGYKAFIEGCPDDVVLPDSVREISSNAMSVCLYLEMGSNVKLSSHAIVTGYHGSVHFRGDAPNIENDPSFFDDCGRGTYYFQEDNETFDDFFEGVPLDEKNIILESYRCDNHHMEKILYLDGYHYDCKNCGKHTDIAANVYDSEVILYELNGGINNPANPDTYEIGVRLTLKAPTRAGYTFAGWYYDKYFKQKVGTLYCETATVYAKWTPNKYSIVFNGNGSTSGSMSKISNVSYNAPKTLTANTYKKKGYTFTGWNTKKDGTGDSYTNKAKVQGLSTKSKGTATLYAQWKIIDYKINYNLNGGINAETNPATYTVKDRVVLAKPTKEHYLFSGWYSDKKYKKKVTTIAAGSTGNRTLYAKWTPIKYSIVFSKNNESYPDTPAASGSMKSMTGVAWNTTKTLTANAFTKKGYTFTGWNTVAVPTEEEPGTTYANKAKVKNLAGEQGAKVTLYAQWRLTNYKINYNLPSDAVNHELNPATYTMADMDIEIQAPTRPGYDFVGWYADAKFKKAANLTIKSGSTGAKTFYPKWKAHKYTVVFDNNDASYPETEPSSGTMKAQTLIYGSTAKLTANAFKKTYYTMTGWNTEPDGSGKTFTNQMAKANVTTENGAEVKLYAQWAPTNYKITYKLNSGALSGEYKKTYTHFDTEAVVLPTPTRKGYTFQGWYTDSKFKASSKITEIPAGSSGNKTVYAKWKKK